jgi:hypothetical protein
MKRAIWYATVLTTLACSLVAPLAAQESTTQTAAAAKPAAAYRLEFVLNELQNGKKIKSHHYEMLAQEGQLNKLRTGVRVPVSVGTAPSSYQYLDVGMNIDCRLQERGSDGQVALLIIADSSNVTIPEGEQFAHAPVIQQLRTEVDTLVSPGKPTVVSSMDDPSSTRRFQLEVTATRVQ